MRFFNYQLQNDNQLSNTDRPKTLNTGCFFVQHPVLTDSFRTVCPLTQEVLNLFLQQAEFFL